MKKRLWLMIGMIACISIAAMSGRVQGAGPVKQTWEYKNLLVVVVGTSPTYMEDGARTNVTPTGAGLVEKINALGRDGWEMTGVASSSSGGVGYWFKRPK